MGRAAFLRRHSCLLLLIGILLLVSTGVLHAQSTNSSLSGIVKDQSGAVVPKAQLSLISVATGTETVGVSGADGMYRFSNLQAGSYNMTVTAAGFPIFSRQGIVLALNDTATLDVSLTVGTGTQTVTVTADASPINHE